MTFLEAYQSLYETFVVLRGLDEDDTYWSAEDKLAFQDAYRKLLVAYNREPL